MRSDGKVPDLLDPAREASWQVWYQDMFDRECPRQVEVSGQGLTPGLMELWARHLFETVGADGKEGFNRFDLWWEQEKKSVNIVGSWKGMVRLREWIFGGKRQARKGYVGDGDVDLLTLIARMYAYLIAVGQSSEKILTTAAIVKIKMNLNQIILF